MSKGIKVKIQHLDHITITSQDPRKSITFYKEVLGMSLAFEWPEEITMLKAGETFVAIAWWSKGKKFEQQPPITVDHFAFRVDKTTYDGAREALTTQGIPIDHESDHGICRSLYFRDPDNHLLELTCYELKGQASKMPRFLD